MSFRGTFENNWKEMLIQGGVWQDKQQQRLTSTISGGVHRYLRNFVVPDKMKGKTLAVNYSHRFFDGRGANKSGLWELPH